MDHKIKVLIWSMTGNDEFDRDSLEWNVLKPGNML